jgi:hypothetical protein
MLDTIGNVCSLVAAAASQEEAFNEFLEMNKYLKQTSRSLQMNQA